MLRDATVREFQKSLRGELILRNDPRYEEARKLYNGMIDKRPLLIARCVDIADVITAVSFGRDQDLLIAIRGGGHNGPGLGSCDDGLVIDLSMTKSVGNRQVARPRSNILPNPTASCDALLAWQHDSMA